jgi:hypothetical protein
VAESVIEYVAEQAIRHRDALRAKGQTARHVRADLKKAGKYDSRRDLDLRKLAGACYGHAAESKLRQLAGMRAAGFVAEAVEAVDHTTFRDLLGAEAVEAVEVGYNTVESPVDMLTTVVDGGMDPNNEKLYPYKAAADSPSQDVAPGMEYPKTNFRGYKVRSPIPVKHGLIALFTLETFMANERLQFLDELGEVGRVVRLAQVQKRMRPALGIVNNWTTVSAAGTATTADTYVATGRANLIDDLNLANGPTAFDALMRVFSDQVHPLTGKPIRVGSPDVLTVRNNLFTLQTLITGVKEIRTTTGGVEFVSGNPVAVGTVMTDEEAYNLLTTEAGVEATALSAAEASSVIVVGNFQRAFRTRVVKPFETFEAGPGDTNEGDFASVADPAFLQDVVYGVKGRIWEVSFTHDPYEVLFAYNAD